MRLLTMIFAIAGLALPGVAGADAPLPTTSSAASAKTPKVRARNAIDRTSTDPGIATFRSFDADGDGYLSREEARESAELARRFDALDRNRDGRLSSAELTGWRNVSYRPAASAPAVPGEQPGNIPPTLKR